MMAKSANRKRNIQDLRTMDVKGWMIWEKTSM